MTLKEKVAEMEPEKVGHFDGGVMDCPSGYDYLNDDAGEDVGTCIRNCEECWNREYHPKEEKPVDVQALLSDLHALMWMGEGCRICAHCVIEQRAPYMKTGCKLKGGCEPLWRGLVEDSDAPGV
jgi:hypothetical protein